MKKGFTLIELLAVIVILAIIALIAVPIVVNIINDSKKESQQRSLDLYIDHAQKAITKYQMTHPGFNPKECTIEDKKLTCDGTKIEVEMKGQVPERGTITIVDNKLYYDVTLEGKKYVLEVPPAKATDEDYRGYYADVDGDGEPDGVIYADLSQSSRENASWGGYPCTYSYRAQTGLKEYTVSKEVYKANEGFGEKKIITAKKGSMGNERFYIMSLEDFTEGSFEEGNAEGYDLGTYYWYKNTFDTSTWSGRMNTFQTDTSIDFGTGYANTGKIIEIWNRNGIGNESYIGATQDNRDIWKYIQTKYRQGWYIPSSGEWAAFADYFTQRTNNPLTSYYDSNWNHVGNENYRSLYELSSWYWTSSQSNENNVWSAYIGNGYIDQNAASAPRYVRLGATF